VFQEVECVSLGRALGLPPVPPVLGPKVAALEILASWRQMCTRRGYLWLTSEAVVLKADQSSRVRMFNRSLGSLSRLSLTSSQSLGWRGNEVELDLQALTAQVRKLSVRSFIMLLVVLIVCGDWNKLCGLDAVGGEQREMWT
jgi:hypothetical protein